MEVLWALVLLMIMVFVFVPFKKDKISPLSEEGLKARQQQNLKRRRGT